MSVSDFAQHMEAVARRLLGEPNRALSSRRELRYGTHGSLSVDLEKGVWKDFENDEGGGVLDLVRRETGRTTAGAADWMREQGFALGEAPRFKPAPRPRAETVKDRQIAKTGTDERRPLGRIVKAYDYDDEDGVLLYRVVRLEPKHFLQRRPDGRGGWKWTTKHARKVLYRLPELLVAPEDALVFVVEGEKDTDRLIGLGLRATTSPEGAGHWHDAYADHLVDFRIVVVADNGKPGEGHAADVMASCRARHPRRRGPARGPRPPW